MYAKLRSRVPAAQVRGHRTAHGLRAGGANRMLHLAAPAPANGRRSALHPPGFAVDDVTDEELDTHITTRLKLLGVDLSVLPEDDPEAPVDRRRILASARRFLRSTPGAIADLDLDPQDAPPLMYPSIWAGARRQAP